MRLAAVAFALLLGCGSADGADPPDWYGDERFTPDERAAIQLGAEWLYAHAGKPPPRIEWSYRVDGDARVPQTIRRERGPHATGECVGSTVYLAEVGPDVYLPGFAAHELAHCALGFVDRPTEGIMRVLYPMAWTSDEEAQCREHADRCQAASGSGSSLPR